MSDRTFLKWISEETATTWWNDSGIPEEISRALDEGAVGVTTNPVLSYRALSTLKEPWKEEIKEAIQGRTGPDKATALTGVVVKKAAAMLHPVFRRTDGRSGYVCSQVDPSATTDRDVMLKTAVTMSSVAENVSVKLPATAAGLDVMEEAVCRGMHVTMTVSFTLPQVLAIAERYRKARKKAEASAVKPGTCYAVVMIGRLDDYLRDVAADMKADIDESDITRAGLAVVKRAYGIYKKEDYKAELIIAAMRGPYHTTELAGSGMVMSIHPKHQAPLMDPALPKEELIDKPVNPASVEKLLKIPEFVRAYEPDGMKPEEFLSFGAEQRTLTQFSEAGWKLLEGFEL